ncbi:TapB family protein [Dyadobacter tibetensis]|uniref:TapB family protein n=1 Tax=Dyadobacter tibetensis TaxID=1211851 RepID=UPI00103D8C5C|nr:hypothetical protein [Dyadobacter tibetensis]
MKNFNFKQNSRKAIFGILAASSVFFQTGCKDDEGSNPTPGTPNESTAFIPSKDKKYTYKIVEEDGSTTMEYLRVKSVKDSSGLAVSYLESKLIADEDTVILDWKAYSTAAVTTYEISYANTLLEVQDLLSQMGEVLEFNITGFPNRRLMENKIQEGSKLTFQGDPIKLTAKIKSEDNDEPVIVEMEATVTYKNGTVTKVENITTPAGTFKCSKWSYGYTSIVKFFINGQLFDTSTDVYTIEEWTSPGIGRVKTEETFGDIFSKSELQKIE